MKFYEVPSYIYTTSLDPNYEYLIIDGGNIVVQVGLYNCEEVMTNKELLVMSSKKAGGNSAFKRAVSSTIEEQGFCFVVQERDFIPRNYAKKENVSKYFEGYQKTGFYKFFLDHKHVYGKEHKEIKKMIKKAKKQK